MWIVRHVNIQIQNNIIVMICWKNLECCGSKTYSTKSRLERLVSLSKRIGNLSKAWRVTWSWPSGRNSVSRIRNHIHKGWTVKAQSKGLANVQNSCLTDFWVKTCDSYVWRHSQWQNLEGLIYKLLYRLGTLYCKW